MSQINVDVYNEPENKDVVAIVQNAIKEAKSKNKNVLIIDTAGRLAIDEVMMTEVANIKSAVDPKEILFVVDSMTGQDAVNTAAAFNQRLNYTGVVLTKLDGDTRGGAAISIKSTVNKPIKFVSSGEKMDTLDVFYPERMAQRILGMGDIVSLVEKAQEQFDEVQAAKLEKRIRKNQFDFEDFKTQLQQIKKMGNLKDLMGMIPGVGKQIKDIDINDDAFKGIEAMINSMTLEERRNPDIINPGRKQRIAKGSGKDIAELNQFIKQFDQMKNMMKMMNKMPMGKLAVPGKKIKSQLIIKFNKTINLIYKYYQPPYFFIYFICIFRFHPLSSQSFKTLFNNNPKKISIFYGCKNEIATPWLQEKAILLYSSCRCPKPT